MALNIGELVGIIRADDSGWRSGLETARLRMRGLQRDADGTLRDLRGRFVSEGDAAGRGLADGIRAHAELAAPAVKKVGIALGALGVGVPAVAAATAALGGLAAGAAAAGLAVRAFKLAAQPQLDAVAESSAAAEAAEAAHEQATLKKAAAQKLAKKGGDEYTSALREAESATKAAKEADAAYEQQLAGLPPATRAYAKELQGLKDDHQKWSDSLSSTTMPVFTKGIKILRDLLPTLTPFVKAAAKAFSGFLDSVARGVKSARFKEWADDMANAAGPALTNFLTVVKNFAVGFAGLLQAFTSSSQGATGGLVAMSEAFAKWGASLKGSEGFAKFLELAREGGTTLGQLALAAGNLLVALGPLIGVTTQVALALARIINALPPGVLSVLATTVASVAIAMKAYAAGAAVAATANRVLASSTYTAIAGWARMMAAGLMAYVRIAGAAVASAARTAAAWAGAALRSMATFAAQVIRTAAVAVAQFALMAARAVAWAAVMAAQWLVAMGPIGWVIAAIAALVGIIVVAYQKSETFRSVVQAVWSAIQTAVSAAVSGIGAAISWFGTLPGLFSNWFGQAKDWVVTKFTEMVAWVAGVPGRVSAALAGLLGALRDRAASAGSAMVAAIRQRLSDAIAWVRGLPGRARSALGDLGGVLAGAGRALIRGFVNGITSMVGSVRNAAKSVVSAARNFFPFSPAKEGPFSGKGYTLHSGRALAGDFGRGITDQMPYLQRVMNSLPTPAVPALAAPGLGALPAGVAAGGAPQRGPVELVVREGSGGRVEALLTHIIRDTVAVKGGGDVQKAFGRR